MSASDPIYQLFLQQMQGLEAFRKTYIPINRDFAVDTGDPDVQRLLEALAWFSASTQLAVKQNLEATGRRMARGAFDYLLSPLPSMALLEATCNDQKPEPVTLKKGSLVWLTTTDRQSGIFRTLIDLPTLPIHLVGATLDNGGMTLSFASRSVLKAAPGTLNLQVWYRDYTGSNDLLYRLQLYLDKASVRFDGGGTQGWIDCETRFGMPPNPPDDTSGEPNEVADVRTFFHFPERELYVGVTIPQAPPSWSTFDLRFALDPAWASGLSLQASELKSVFRPFVTPLENLHEALAAPIVGDGTSSTYPIRSAGVDPSIQLHSVLGVYQKTTAGLTPVQSGLLPNADSYEVEPSASDPTGQQFNLILNLPEAFEQPRNVVVDALWYQPGFAPPAGRRLRVQLDNKFTAGLIWQVAGAPCASKSSPVLEQESALLNLMSLSMKAWLTVDELKCLLGYLGSIDEGYYAAMPDYLRDLTWTRGYALTNGAGVLKLVYTLHITAPEAGDEALLAMFLRQVGRLLSAWSADALVDVLVQVGSSAAVALEDLTLPPEGT